MANQLNKAKIQKNDEFYTQYSDIEKEMNAYYEYDKDVFRNKTVLLPCDDPEWSNFTKYFAANFERFGLKKLISTSYAKSAGNENTSDFEKKSDKYDEEKHKNNGKIFVLERDVNNSGRIDYNDIEFDYLEGDGDFRSDEVKALRDEADIIITNPPFSLFREFLDWIETDKRKFIIIGNQNAITYKEVFPKIKNNQIWLGPGFNGNAAHFINKYYTDYATASDHKEGMIRVSGVVWFTNLDYGARHERLTLMTMADNLKYNKKLKKKFETSYGKLEYPKYDNYDAIEIPFSDAIPSDYEGVMGVPITFLDKYCPEQFEILWILSGHSKSTMPSDLAKQLHANFEMKSDQNTNSYGIVKGHQEYHRILIQKKENLNE